MALCYGLPRRPVGHDRVCWCTHFSVATCSPVLHAHHSLQIRTDLVQGLTMRSHHVLNHDIAVYEVGAHPGWIEDCEGVLQKHQAHNVIANVTLLVHLLLGHGRVALSQPIMVCTVSFSEWRGNVNICFSAFGFFKRLVYHGAIEVWGVTVGLPKG